MLAAQTKADRVRLGPIAMLICADIQKESRRYVQYGLRCARCVRAAQGGIPARLISKPGFQGCDLVNYRYRRLMADLRASRELGRVAES